MYTQIDMHVRIGVYDVYVGKHVYVNILYPDKQPSDDAKQIAP